MNRTEIIRSLEGLVEMWEKERVDCMTKAAGVQDPRAQARHMGAATGFALCKQCLEGLLERAIDSPT